MIDRIVFDVELAEPEALGQPRAANERSEPGIESCPRLAGDGQQLAIPPQVFWPPFDLLTRNPDGAVIVEGLQRAKAPRAGRDRRSTRPRRSRHYPGQSCGRKSTTAGRPPERPRP